MNNIDRDIVEQVLNGTATKQEAESVAKWFATEEGKRYLSERMDSDFVTLKPGLEELFVSHHIPSDRIFAQIEQRIYRKKRFTLYFRVAAVLLPLILLSTLFVQVNNRVDFLGSMAYQEVYVPKGERLQMMMQDGTRIYLNADTKLRYKRNFSFSKRTVMLEGEAYFVVEKNKNRPFVVELDGAEIKVIGTSFDIKAYPENREIIVMLDEGSVELNSPIVEPITLKKGDQLTYDKTTGAATILRPSEPRVYSVWKNNVIAFKDTPLSEILQTLHRWYNVEFNVLDKEALAYAYTFTSNDTYLETILNDLERVAPVRFIKTQKGIEVLMQH